MPSLVNAKDKEDVSLFRNIVKKYIKSIKEEDNERALYYNNLISLILSQRSFSLDTNEKRKTLDLIYSTIDRLSVKKTYAKKNKAKIKWLNNLIDIIKGDEEKNSKIELLANKYNIQVYFNDDILEKAKLVRVTDKDKSDRPLVNEYIITIEHCASCEEHKNITQHQTDTIFKELCSKRTTKDNGRYLCKRLNIRVVKI